MGPGGDALGNGGNALGVTLGAVASVGGGGGSTINGPGNCRVQKYQHVAISNPLIGIRA